MGSPMIWPVVFAILSACVLAGRAHSRHLDRVEARAKQMMQVLDLSYAGEQQTEIASFLASEQSSQAAVTVFVDGQMWICPRGTFEAYLISTEGKVLAVRDLRDVAADQVCVSAPRGKRSKVLERLQTV
jgi:hypothetical protein